MPAFGALFDQQLGGVLLAEDPRHVQSRDARAHLGVGACSVIQKHLDVRRVAPPSGHDQLLREEESAPSSRQQNYQSSVPFWIFSSRWFVPFWKFTGTRSLSFVRPRWPSSGGPVAH